MCVGLCVLSLICIFLFCTEGPHSNDIALIKVRASENGIDFNNYVQPICLPDEYQPNPEGQWCTVTGWGAQLRTASLINSYVTIINCFKV